MILLLGFGRWNLVEIHMAEGGFSPENFSDTPLETLRCYQQHHDDLMAHDLTTGCWAHNTYGRTDYHPGTGKRYCPASVLPTRSFITYVGNTRR